PRPSEKLTAHFSGPYKVKDLSRGKRVLLQSNPHFYLKGKRPDVEFLAVPDDDTALRMYETGALHLLRRLTADAISTYVKRPDFMFVPMLRFDYVGFGPQLKNQKEVRRALSLSVDY